VYWIRWWNHAGMQLFAEAVNILAKDSGCESTELRALAMAHKSYFMGFLGLAEQGYQIANESIALLEPLESPRAIVYAYYSQAVNAYFIYRYQEEVEAIDNMVSVAAELGDKWLQATAMFGRGLGFIVQDDYDGATQIAQANLRLCQEIGDVIGATTPLIVLGHAALARGEFEDARKYYLRCLTISQEIGYDFAMQNAAKYLGKVTLNMGRNAEAEKYLLQSLRITKEIGFLRDLVNLLYEYARLQTARDNIEGAVELLALVIQHPASDMYRMLDGRIRDSASTLLETLKAELPPQRFDAALQRGQQLDLDETVSDLLGA
jgi:tetratricopeptide (TPR) repeat protein